MGTIIEAKAIISAEDRTGGAFAAIQKKLAGLAKGARVSSGLGHLADEAKGLSKSLGDLESKLRAVDRFRQKQARLSIAQTRFAEATSAVEQAARAKAAAGRPSRQLENAYRRAQAAVKAAAATVDDRRASVLAAKGALEGAGVPTAQLAAEERRLKAAIDGTTAALKHKRDALAAASAAQERAISSDGRAASAGNRRALAATAIAAARGLNREPTRGAGLRETAGAALAASGLRTPMLGMAGMVASGAVAHRTVKEGVERQHERVRMTVSGMSPDEIRHAEAEAAKLSARYTPIGQTEIMHMLRNFRSVVGSYEEAAHIMEPALKLRVAALGANPHKAAQLNEDFDKLIKGMEIKGVTQDLPKFTKYMDGMAKAINVFGDTLKPTDYYEMFKYGRQATTNLSEEYMNTVAPTLAQELGGSSAGTAQAAFYRAIVGGKMSNLATNELAKIDLLDPSKVTKTKTGNVKGVAPGGILGSRLAAENPYQWVQQYLLPALTKKGITDPHEIQERIARVFSNQVAAQLVSLFATQQSRIEKDAGLVHGAKGLSAADDYIRKDAGIAFSGLNRQIGNLLGTLSSPAMQTAAGLMTDLAQAIGQLSAAAKAGSEQVVKPGRMLSDEAQKKVNRWGSVLLTGKDEDRDALDAAREADYLNSRDQAVARRAKIASEIEAQRKYQETISVLPEAAQKPRRDKSDSQIAELETQSTAIDRALTEAEQAFSRLTEFDAARKRYQDLRIRQSGKSGFDPEGEGGFGRIKPGATSAFGLNGPAAADETPQFGEGRPEPAPRPSDAPTPPARQIPASVSLDDALKGRRPEQFPGLREGLERIADQMRSSPVLPVSAPPTGVPPSPPASASPAAALPSPPASAPHGSVPPAPPASASQTTALPPPPASAPHGSVPPSPPASASQTTALPPPPASAPHASVPPAPPASASQAAALPPPANAPHASVPPSPPASASQTTALPPPPASAPASGMAPPSTSATPPEPTFPGLREGLERLAEQMRSLPPSPARAPEASAPGMASPGTQGGKPVEATVKPDQIRATLDGRVPVDVTGKLDPVKLEGSATVSVSVKVDGGKVTNMSASSSGHIKANVGTSMAGASGGGSE